MPPTTPTADAPTAKPVRMFASYQLLRLLGKSKRSMAWLAEDTRNAQAVMLVVGRQQLTGEPYDIWLAQMGRAARVTHRGLAAALDIGHYDNWPFAAYDRSAYTSWAERATPQGLPPAHVADWCQQAADAMAVAHDAGCAHHDVQAWNMLVDEAGRVAVIGLAVGAPIEATPDLHATRAAAVADVLGLGLLLHAGLATQPALDEPDVAKAAARLPPLGHETLRLPWQLPRPVPEGLRAIANRATDRQPRQRYLAARTLAQALANWLTTHAEGGGPLALLESKIQAAGVLPAQDGVAERVARLALMDDCRTAELAEVVLEDLALTFDLLRVVNTAQVHGESVSADGAVLMVRRAIAMLGVNGVRRCATALRPWPGPMSPVAADEMARVIHRVKRAARLAVALAPAGYDGEVVALVALMQNLGRLVVQYHFPEEATQIARLTQSEEGAPGMGAQAAALAVLGIDIEAVGDAVARYWGLSPDLLAMVRRHSTTGPVHLPDDDGGMLRTTASCANELADAWWDAPRDRVAHQVHAIAVRYARALGTSAVSLQADTQRLLDENQGAAATSGVGVEPRMPAAA